MGEVSSIYENGTSVNSTRKFQSDVSPSNMVNYMNRTFLVQEACEFTLDDFVFFSSLFAPTLQYQSVKLLYQRICGKEEDCGKRRSVHTVYCISIK